MSRENHFASLFDAVFTSVVPILINFGFGQETPPARNRMLGGAKLVSTGRYFRK
jgi:hypothetical protein